MPTWKARIANLWSESEKVAERRLPFALFVCALLTYAAAFAWHTLANFDLVTLIGPGNADDSFYYFQIAYNLSQGKFSTFDGGITHTNGYHPVWMLLITPFYWIFDKETALFGIKALEIMLVAGGAALIALAARVARLAWPLLFAALPTLYRYPDELLWGMETAPALFMLTLLILAACLYMRDPERWKWRLAAVAFALPWVRLEYIAVSLAATAALCVIEWSRQERRALSLSALANLRRAYIPLIGAIAGTLVYFAYNGLIFGGVLPVSGATKLAWSQAKWAQQGGYDFIENLRYMIRLDAFDYEILLAFEICAYLLIAWRLALRSNERRDWLLTAFLVGMFGLAIGHLAKFAQTVLTAHPSYANELWYFVPAYLMAALIIPARLYIAILLIRRFIAPRRRAAANALSLGVVAIGAAVLLARAGFVEPFRWVDFKSASTQIEWDIASYMGAQVMNRALPEGSVIGSRDAGVIGYFSRFPVVNMDGMVNSYDHLRARPLQQTEGFNFYRRYGITHFANNQWPDRIPDNVIFEGAPYDTPYGEYQFRLWTYDRAPDAHVEIDYSHQIWNSMQPRFDHASDGLGVILAGRTAQAFAKDCPTDEPLIWTWNDQNHERALIEPNLYRSRANMCVALRVLPRGAGQPTQAKITPLKAYFANLAASREPIIRSDFDIYLSDGSLIYTKSECGEADVEARFFANIFPVDADDLPARLKQRGYQTIDFHFHDYGATDDERCWAAVAQPNYPIAEIHAGQYVELQNGYAHLWEGTYKVGADDTRVRADSNPETLTDEESVHSPTEVAASEMPTDKESVHSPTEDAAADAPTDEESAQRTAEVVDFGMLTDREPVIRSHFDVYIIDGSLIYAKPQCDEADVAGRFSVSIYPVDANNLPAIYRQRGYELINFNFKDYGAIAADGKCLAEIALPDYPIAELRAEQYAAGIGIVWEDISYLPGMRIDADFDMLADREPIIRSNFDVYIIDGNLIYAKPQCGQADVDGKFSVSIYPVNASDLPAIYWHRGHHRIDFDFMRYGTITADGNCWAEVALPDYPIAELRTGQYAAKDYVWSGAHRIGPEPDFEMLTDHEPIIRSRFDVYLIDSSLIYTKSQCSHEDAVARFHISISPVDTDDLPDNRRQRGYDAIDFKFDDYGATADDGRCWVEVALPDYPISAIRTGQYEAAPDGYNYLWEAAHRVGPEPDFEMLADHEPIIQSRFDVYLIDSSLIYTKSQCAQEDMMARFYISISPVDTDDLPDSRKHHGYDVIEFNFAGYGATADDGRCWVEVALPDYPIAELRTGQYEAAPDGYNYLWEAAYRVGPEPDFEMLADHEPIVRSRFDVYLIDGSLIHAKSQCSHEDTVARFYISISPVDVDDLPDNRRQRGYDGIEFNFAGYGAITDDGRCWAETNLPDYPIATIRTGQYTVTADGYNYLWEAAHRLE